mmetsp:Transcript_4536/g.6332  ORF Transcript_4536/g.6332 Transcript_4536/m.6332 type:complete len:218 (-) Transcript_4536:51-704(-)|eukprot:CAMPEP_0168559414 /NCGR_PEP_ID=MMETSP0413-20121227/10510_1 /TAXON_ID=136452 /ORGANISM="Filamoeba nolandi, Strain NC-AS-23-1" /LENGTH=217 /DNA_ID=CAMNT_0008590639 /DNA_START=122 /DNA_END=775 /DNA_ORIENTATION=-
MSATGKRLRFKIVLLGEGRVGKTSCTLRYCKNEFNEAHNQTIQAACLQKNLNVDGQSVTLDIWDTAGQEKFRALGPIYYRDAQGALLVYDITDADSFEKVQSWVKELRKMVGTDIVLAIAGNKIDLERNRVVPLEKAEAYAQSVGAKHFSTSSKLNKGLHELFLDMTKRMVEQKMRDGGSSTSTPSNTNNPSPGQKKGGITFTDEEPQSNSGGECAC